MPRRLGDDPLARAKNARAIQAARAQSGTSVLASGSHNDVFFQKRADLVDTVVVTPEPLMAPEISEISQLPEIREASTMPIVDVVQPDQPDQPSRPPSFVEEPRTDSSQPTPPSAPSALASAPTPPAEPADQPGSEAGKGGLLKRLLGKL